MINYLKSALSTELAMEVANRISERKDVISLGQIFSRLMKFAAIGVAGLVIALAMIALAGSGAVEQLHTQRLVTFIALGGGLIFAYSIVSSFSLMVDGLVVEYSRRIAAQQAESEMAEALHELDSAASESVDDRATSESPAPSEDHHEEDVHAFSGFKLVSVRIGDKEYPAPDDARREKIKQDLELSPKEPYYEIPPEVEQGVTVSVDTEGAVPEDLHGRISKVLELMSVSAEVDVPYSQKKWIARELKSLFDTLPADRKTIGFLVNSLLQRYKSETEKPENPTMAH